MAEHKKHRDLYWTGDVERILNIGGNTVRRLFDKRVLKGFKVPGKTHPRRIFPESVLKFVIDNSFGGYDPVSVEFLESDYFLTCPEVGNDFKICPRTVLTRCEQGIFKGFRVRGTSSERTQRTDYRISKRGIREMIISDPSFAYLPDEVLQKYGFGDPCLVSI